MLVEDLPLDPSLRSLKASLPDCDAWQISARGRKDYVIDQHIHVALALTFLGLLV